MTLILTVMRQRKPTPRLQFVQTGSITHSIEADALVVRDETVLAAPASGTVRPLTGEGVRVAADARLAMVVASGMDTILTELENCEQQIAEIQMELMAAGDIPEAVAVFGETDEELLAIVRLMRRDLSARTLGDMTAYRYAVDRILEDRESRLLSVDFRDARLTQLAGQRESLTWQLSEHAGIVTSPRPGIVSYRFDGLEADLTPETVRSLICADLDAIRERQEGYRGAEGMVEADDPVVRISNGLEQYLAFTVPSDQTGWFQPGSIHTVQIPEEGLVIENAVVTVLTEEADRALVVLKTDRKVLRLFDLRTVSCSISLPDRTVTGLRVPLSALTSADGQDGIMVLQSGVIRFAPVTVLDRDRSYAIIEPPEDNPYGIRTASVVVTNPGSVQEGDRISE